jgi:flagellar biosynthesis protein FlhB
MNIVVRFLVRALLIVAGLIFAASLMVLMLVLLVLWCVRALWCKLTGQPVNPFAMRINPRAGFDQVFKRAERGTGNLIKPKRSGMDDVTDVEPKR